MKSSIIRAAAVVLTSVFSVGALAFGPEIGITRNGKEFRDKNARLHGCHWLKIEKRVEPDALDSDSILGSDVDVVLRDVRNVKTLMIKAVNDNHSATNRRDQIFLRGYAIRMENGQVISDKYFDKELEEKEALFIDLATVRNVDSVTIATKNTPRYLDKVAVWYCVK